MVVILKKEKYQQRKKDSDHEAPVMGPFLLDYGNKMRNNRIERY